MKKPIAMLVACLMVSAACATAVATPLAAGAGSHADLWGAVGGRVLCGRGAHAQGAPAELLCFSRVIPPPSHTSTRDGDPGYVYLSTVGRPQLVRLSQYSWESQGGWLAANRAALRAGQIWSDGALAVTCTIGSRTVRCVNQSGHGFAISRSRYRSF
jgi:hypothetical protein